MPLQIEESACLSLCKDIKEEMFVRLSVCMCLTYKYTFAWGLENVFIYFWLKYKIWRLKGPTRLSNIIFRTSENIKLMNFYVIALVFLLVLVLSFQPHLFIMSCGKFSFDLGNLKKSLEKL